MKKCPQCGREYDLSMMFCLDDGAELLYGPASDEPATAILSDPGAPVTPGSSDEPATETFSIADTNATLLKSATPNSIAVLPFMHMSSDEDNEYFCDGLAEELINALSKIDGLRVAARTSTFSFKGKDTDISEIARKLGVLTILEGSVRKSGDQMRITVQLINAADGYHLWSERYDREMKDIFDIQDEITLAVVDALKIKLFGAERSAVVKRHTENTDAYRAYLKGRYLRHAKNDHFGALQQFEEAVRLDPAHAPSWVGVAEALILSAHYALVPAREACASAAAALAKAKELTGETAHTVYVEAFIAYVTRDWTALDRAFIRSDSFHPPHPNAKGSYGLIKSVLGRFDEADQLFAEAREADPLAAFPYAATGAGLVTARKSAEAITFLEQAFAFEPDNMLALWASCSGYMALGNFEQAIKAAERVVENSMRAPFFVGLLGWTYAISGQSDQARLILEELQQRPDTEPALVSQAWLLGALGHKDEAFSLLARAQDELQAYVLYLGMPGFDTLRDDPRFEELTRRLNFPAPPK
jgi:TolB-like protein/Flp pilus assembly protein TadD